MNIGIIGAGGMGISLASKCVTLGHTVSIANSRGPASLSQLANNIGAVAVAVDDVLKNKHVIIVSIPVKNVPDLPAALFKQLPTDVVVIDTGNYYPTLRDGTIATLDQHGIDSMWVQEQLGVPVVKVFNAILATSIQDLGKPKGNSDRIAIPISGNDPKAKQIACELVDQLGFDPFDIGALSQSWKQQPGSPLYCRDITLVETKKRANALGTDWTIMRDVILTKRKSDEALMKADYPTYLKGLRN
ncbi:NADPH-dependent F420 reductase [Chryseolinea lacunae]|uniref:NAD(P)-binding domain-containing protein n=1 Tax=Chryseolinea lacunae TaxID=2801331 RepID=A0ABS1L1H8_9BACT|nr:NAD(P)-binding domain-containing protein [Chryseolinea lacunae]MBL0745541.1 NAD(P)-binding domain-containing protein [Chryseolinea lacunae]